MGNRAIQDAQLSVSTAFGINNATTSTNAIDLGAVTPFPVTEGFMVQISTTVTANAANNKNVNISFEHSNVNTAANFAAISELSTLVLAADGGNIAATTRNVALPPSVKRFIRIKCVTENAGGNPNDATATLKLLF
jgi:hypothetical protein